MRDYIVIVTREKILIGFGDRNSEIFLEPGWIAG
jgi:hypothetical protein